MQNAIERISEFNHKDYKRLVERVQLKIDEGYGLVHGIVYDGALVQYVQKSDNPKKIVYKIIQQCNPIIGNLEEHKEEAKDEIVKDLSSDIDFANKVDGFSAQGEPSRLIFEPSSLDYLDGCFYIYQAMTKTNEKRH